jgi:RHS repeat-associated protein
VNSNTYTHTATYRPAGLSTETYQSGRVVSYSLDSAGRLSGVTGKKGTTPDVAYASSIAYAAQGATRSTLLGNGLTESWTFNYRLQPATVSVGPAGSLMMVYFGYCAAWQASCATNNGNMVSQYRAPVGLQQNYTFDGYNRLASVSEPGIASWSRNFGYDDWSNGWVNSWTGLSPNPFTPVSSANFNSQNRLLIQGSQFNQAGDMTGIGGYSLATDAEGRLRTSTLNSVATSFGYDGEGHRVTKSTAGSAAVVYVYGVGGELMEEYGNAADSAGGTGFLTKDHLGSTRLVTDAAGGAKSCVDYLPFGEELGSWNGRTAACYAGNAGRVKFTGKERDAETGLDYFGARYYSGAQGRFTTPDPLMASAHVADPQSWNRYSYARNNPLRYVDPDGMEVPPDCAKDNKCTIAVKVNVVYDGSANNGKGLTGDQKKKFEQGQIAKAQKEYGTSNIKLDVSYTPGEVTKGADGKTYISGLKNDSLNVVVRDRGGSFSDVDQKSDMAVTVVNINDAHNGTLWPLWTNTTSHELGHQFLGDPYREWNPWVYTFYREPLVDAKVGEQVLGTSQPRFRDGLEKRRYAAPLNPEANKPRQ